jgi:hypothetical protein
MYDIETELKRVSKDHSAQAPGRSNLLLTADFGVRAAAVMHGWKLIELRHRRALEFD